MSRTRRETNGEWYRSPQTYNLKRQLREIRYDEDFKELVLGKRNRIYSMNPPSRWDDMKISGLGESKYPKKQN